MGGMLRPWPSRWPSPAKRCNACQRYVPAAALTVLVAPGVSFSEVVARICPLCHALGRGVRLPRNPARAASTRL